MSSIKIIRIVYLVTCCRVPIIIGLMHLYVHFNELMSDALRDYLDKEFLILSQYQQLWYTWGMTSLMMGVGFLIIGLLNSTSFIGLEKKEPPSFSLLLIGVFYYLAILYSGIVFNQNFQLFGGFICANLLIFCSVFIKMGYNAPKSSEFRQNLNGMSDEQ